MSEEANSRERRPNHQVLTVKEQRFVDEYLIDGNGARAHTAAGYRGKTMVSHSSEANRILKKPKVAEVVAKRREELSRRSQISQEKTLEGLARIAFADVRTVFKRDGTMIPVSEFPDEFVHAIASIETEEKYMGKGEERRLVGHVKKLRLNDRVAALGKIAECLGISKGKGASTLLLSQYVKVNLDGLSVEELRRIANADEPIPIPGTTFWG
jgi:phage terminase small subunit